MTEHTIIPKDCAVCDSCNKGLTDGDFIATDPICYWVTENLLLCESCYIKYYKKGVEQGDYQMIMIIYKGDDLSKTELAQPIEMFFFTEKDEIKP